MGYTQNSFVYVHRSNGPDLERVFLRWLDTNFWRTENRITSARPQVLINHKLVLPRMTPSLWTLRVLLFKMSGTGDSPVVKQHSRYMKEFLKSLSKDDRPLHSRKIPRASSLLPLAKFPCRIGKEVKDYEEDDDNNAATLQL